MMRRTTQILLLNTLVQFFQCEAISAEQGTNAYHTIAERNVFRLKPQTQAAPPEQPQTARPARIVLTGITTILGDKRVLLKIIPVSNPGEPPGVEESCILILGQRQGVVQILNVDEKKGDVTIDNAGSIMTLNIDKEAVKPVTARRFLETLPPPPAVFPHRA